MAGALKYPFDKLLLGRPLRIDIDTSCAPAVSALRMAASHYGKRHDIKVRVHVRPEGGVDLERVPRTVPEFVESEVRYAAPDEFEWLYARVLLNIDRELRQKRELLDE